MMRGGAWLLALLCAASLSAAEYRAGTAAVRITPELPFWLSGFAARTRPADKVTLDLYAKALALDDGRSGRVVIITADLIGLTREITSEVATRLQREHGLRRDQVVFNASHTHSGPSIWPRLNVAPIESPEVDRQIEAYSRRLIDQLASVAGRALQQMTPVDMAFGESTASFAINRRTEHLAKIRPGEQFPAPVDHTVPVWKFTSPDGKVKAVLFGYACHNTVLTSDFAEVNGDYAGYAQRALEQDFPGATALFLTLCAGDQRAMPRARRELAEQHGNALAQAVRSAIDSRMTPLQGPIRTAYEEIRLPFQVHSRESYDAESKSTDIFAARRGKRMLAAIDAGHPVRDTPYPAAAIRLGDGTTLLALGGEVVVDYALRLKKEYSGSRLVVAGYSNDVMGYIPSLRIQREGGYEAGDSLMYFVQPGWFTEEVEPLVIGVARRMLAAVGQTPPSNHSQ